MFKPLLKTIPSLSGNMKIVCKLEGYNIDKKYPSIYNCVVNEAYLTSLSSNLYDKNIKINLKNNSFEYDVKKFYLYYASVFYDNNFKFSKINIPIIDFSSVINDSNQDFKYGCKRISYKKSQNQFAYFAPIYIESLDDLQGKYFVISCTFDNGVSKLTKFIKIQISNVNENNYLADYLCRYASKIDDKVIYCSNSYKNIYYGIDLKHGGFVKIEDNISQNIYNKYYTINDFDATLNNGFKRNYMMMKQILALSFYFDTDYLLYKFEKHLYNNCEIIISGHWYDANNNEIKFYDFSDNYNIYTEDIYNLYYKNTFKYVNTGYNIMNMKYPACNESMSENYKYVNTVVKNYNRWKLKYSKDNFPYIINNNNAFSANQFSLYTYKEFPIMYSPIRAYAKLISNLEYNLLFDYDDIYKDDNITPINNKNLYYNLYNQNHITNFYDLIIKNDKNNKQENTNYINIFDSIYDDFWSDVDKDGKVYHKGILYDLNTVYNNNLNMPFKIDKFGVFVLPKFSYTFSYQFNDIYKRSKFLFSYDFTNGLNEYELDKIYNYREMNIKSTYLYNDVLVLQDPNGNYIDTSIINYKQYDINKYFDFNDILFIYLKKFTINTIKVNNLFKEELFNQFTNKESKLDFITGYKVIDIYNISNIYGEYFENLIWQFRSKNGKNDGIIFRESKFLEIEKIYWSVDKIYFSIWPNKTKYSLVNNYELLKNYKDDNIRIVLYYKTKFIKDDESTREYIDSYLDKYFKDNSNINDFKSELQQLSLYYYSNGLYDTKNKIKYTDYIFKKIDILEENYGSNVTEDDKNIIYIDPYNLKNIYNVYLHINKNDNEIDEIKANLETFFCIFLNIDHIRKYYEKLYNNFDLTELTNKNNNINENNNTDCKNKYVINHIYVRIRNFNYILNDTENSDLSTVFVNNDYINIKNFGLDNVNDLIFNVSYNELLHCFYFNENYFNNYISVYQYIIDTFGDINIIIDESGNLNNIDNYDLDDDIKFALQDKNIRTAIRTLDNYKITNFELCFEKQMMKLNEDLYKLIIHRKNNEIFKDLYLYHLYDPKDNYCPMRYKVTNWNKATLDQIKKDNDYVLNSDSHILLYPYFNSIYEEGQTETKIYSDYFINNIISCPINDQFIYKYNEQNINFLANVPKNSNIEIDDKYRYSVVSDVEDYFINKNEFAQLNICDENKLDNYSNIITYNYNGTYYGFYVISSYFDNTKNTINIQNDDLEYINCVDYIDGISVDKINEYSYSYLGTIYQNLLPYMAKTNPVKFILTNSEVLIKPHIYKLENKIKQYPNRDNNGLTYSYTLYHARKSSNIELSRYFNNIVPYIPEVKYLYSYNLYYKNTIKFIENDLDINKQSYIMYNNQYDINRFTYISYFENYIDNGVNFENGIEKIRICHHIPTEYKYYNDNKFFNLEKEIIIPIYKDFTENELIEYEHNQDNIFKLFMGYMNIDKFDSLSYRDKINNYLFLYKKYNVSFIENFKYVNETNNKIFSLSIKFNLL